MLDTSGGNLHNMPSLNQLINTEFVPRVVAFQ